MKISAILWLLVSGSLHAQGAPPPIIDMHLHALRVADFGSLAGPPPIPHCVPMTDYPIPESGRRWSEVVRSRDLPCRATWSPMTDDEVMVKTLETMRRRNVIGVTSGAHVARWMEAAPDRVIPSLSFAGGPDAPAVVSVREWFKAGRFAVFGEVTAQYGGMAPDDPSLAPYWALAEELNVPVGIHIGTGPVGAPYVGFERYRARLHSPLGLEEVLLGHPNLRVYIMHAGWPMLDDLLAVLWTHPQVYVDVGAIVWALPRAEFHRYLQRIVEAGFGKRVLFGSDQMIWPETLEMAIQTIESAAFLTAEQRRDIFFNNAARFLRLSPEQIATMHSKKRN
ncbi:MAG: amidohydrolase family protein [Vicinamibacterales bacterium]